MTPAEQIRATMALLEAIQESQVEESDLVQDTQALLAAAQNIELDEGWGDRVKAGAVGLALASGLSFSTIAQADPAQQAYLCSAFTSALSDAFKASNAPAEAKMAAKSSENWEKLAGQYGMPMRDFDSTFDSEKVSQSNLIKKKGQAYVTQALTICADMAKSMSAGTAAKRGAENFRGASDTAAAAKERAQDRENSQRQAQSAPQSTQQPLNTTQGRNGLHASTEGMNAARDMLNGNKAMRDNIASNFAGTPAWPEFKKSYDQWYQIYQNNGMRQR
jgi:hypothetical protein